MCANLIAHKHRAHDAFANSHDAFATQLPPRPDLEFSLEFILGFCWKLGALQVQVTARASPRTAECDRRSPDFLLLRWRLPSRALGPKLDWHSNFEPQPLLSQASHELSPNPDSRTVAPA